MKNFIVLIAILFLTAACWSETEIPDMVLDQDAHSSRGEVTESLNEQSVNVDFSEVSSIFLFSGQIPASLDVEYVKAAESINIYDPQKTSADNLAKSQIFIRYFRANRFLTLSSVNIISREETEINGHAAVRYEIEKKPNVANFINQPSWRNLRHKLIDIRYAPSGTTNFYVFSYNPELDSEVFEAFIRSLKFQNDLEEETESASTKEAVLKAPISKWQQRITKKPFGIEVSPQNSPVSPEKFSGFHNAVDFEILEGETDTDVEVFAICKGSLLQKRTATGYGGLVVQECKINGQPVTVNYGHLRLLSVKQKIGDMVEAGELLGVLGTGYSKETDGERKHLHLGLHKGGSPDIRGYVQKENELSQWLDFEELFNN
jgi:murein DD-endopeptidase MepM/ murein hydrolase activator NlpD